MHKRLGRLLVVAFATLASIADGADVQLLSNPGFESGRGAGWVTSSDGGYGLIYDAALTSQSAHFGRWYAWLGTYSLARDSLYQDVFIPADAAQVVLQFFMRITTFEGGTTEYDVMRLSVVEPASGAVLEELDRASNVDARVWTQTRGYDLTRYRGRTIRIRFDATTDDSLSTSFFLDDFTLTATTGAPSPALTNFSDIWWDPAESGWGLTIADHETQLFAVWFTYRQDGTSTWMVIPGGNFSENRRIFTADVYEARGPSYEHASFDSSAVTVSRVGTMRLDMAPSGGAPGAALFSYDIGGITGTKQIVRQSFGNAAPNWGNDFTDIWWNPQESGWGMTLAQHGNQLFGVWFTYGEDGRPLWVVMPGVTFQGPNAFSGDLYTATGPYFGNTFFDSSRVRVTRAGDASFSMDVVPLQAQAKQFMRRGTMRTNFRNRVQFRTLSPQPFGTAPVVNGPPIASHNSLTVTKSGFGTVTSAPAGISCGGSCSASFAATSNVTLTAQPDSGWSFNRWEGGCAGTQPTCSVYMNQQQFVTAVFGQASAPPVTGVCSGQGAIRVTGFAGTACSGLMPHNETVRINFTLQDWASSGARQSLVEIDKASFFCSSVNGRLQVYRQYYGPTIALTRDATGTLVGQGMDTVGGDQFQIDFRIPGGINVAGNISLTSSFGYQWSGTFSCIPPR